jgi:hypothetical protein
VTRGAIAAPPVVRECVAIPERPRALTPLRCLSTGRPPRCTREGEVREPGGQPGLLPVTVARSLISLAPAALAVAVCQLHPDDPPAAELLADAPAAVDNDRTAGLGCDVPAPWPVDRVGCAPDRPGVTAGVVRARAAATPTNPNAPGETVDTASDTANLVSRRRRQDGQVGWWDRARLADSTSEGALIPATMARLPERGPGKG